MAALKVMFIWRPGTSASLETFSSEAQATLSARLQGLALPEVVLHVTERAPPRVSVLPWRREPLALISARTDSVERLSEALSGLSGRLEAYSVDEALPVARTRTWPAGTRAPGATLLTLFRKNAALSRAEFLTEWFEVHTPLSLKIHPLWGYTRNAVQGLALAGSTSWDGIVTEDFRTAEDLLDPRRLFGGALRAIPNMARVGLHVSKFLELSTLENYLVAEYVLPR